MELLNLHEAMCLLSGDNAAAFTQPHVTIINWHSPVDAFHFQIVLSTEPETRYNLSCDHVMELMLSV